MKDASTIETLLHEMNHWLGNVAEAKLPHIPLILALNTQISINAVLLERIEALEAQLSLIATRRRPSKRSQRKGSES